MARWIVGNYCPDCNHVWRPSPRWLRRICPACGYKPSGKEQNEQGWYGFIEVSICRRWPWQPWKCRKWNQQETGDE